MTTLRHTTQGRPARRAALWASLIAVIVATPLALAGCTSSGATSAPTVVDTYGGLPSYLASTQPRVDQVLTGTVDRPALSVEGDEIDVVTKQGTTVRADIVGPVVPGEGLSTVQGSTTCTWTITLSRASRALPLSLAQFSTIDQLGHVYTLTLAPGQRALPATLAAGQTLSFKVRTIMVTGEGLMRWAPDEKSILAKWDFVVEND